MENKAKVTLFTRPRRFGKTLNMSMLQNFFEIGRDPSLFDGLAISRETELCELSIPNREIMNLCQDMLEGWFIDKMTKGDRLAPLYKALDDGDAASTEEELRRCLRRGRPRLQKPRLLQPVQNRVYRGRGSNFIGNHGKK